MKKILTVCLTVLAIFCFAACERGGANASNSSPEVEQNTADFFRAIPVPKVGHLKWN